MKKEIIIKEIGITVDNGKVKVKPNNCKAYHLDHVKWHSRLPFVVYFGYVSPLWGNVFGKGEPEGKVKYNADLYGPRKFKYLVGVYKNGKILIMDPDLDIQPQP